MSPKMRLTARKLYYLPSDLWRKATGKKNRLEPAKGDIYIGSGDFIAQGKHQLQLLVELVGLKPTNSVLDVGSGIGRTAVALTNYLNEDGKYEGFDVVEKGVKWCNEHIKKEHPNFNFQYIPLNNDLYNNSKESAENFNFPYSDNQFDLVLLFSVFTHMRPSEIRNYLFEIQRVLKKGGKCLATFFVFNEQEETFIAESNAFRFPFKKNGFRLMDKNVECANIAFKDSNLFKVISESGLEITNVVNGYWKNMNNKKDLADFQDIIVITK